MRVIKRKRSVWEGGWDVISQRLFIKSFCKSSFPHKFVNKFFILVIMKDTMRNKCGNWLLQNNLINTFCEMRAVS